MLELAGGVKTYREGPCPPLERDGLNVPYEASIKIILIWHHTSVCDEPVDTNLLCEIICQVIPHNLELP